MNTLTQRHLSRVNINLILFSVIALELLMSKDVKYGKDSVMTSTASSPNMGHSRMIKLSMLGQLVDSILMPAAEI